MRWATLMDGDVVREIVAQDDQPEGGIAVPDSISPIPGKWHYDAAKGFYPDAAILRYDMTAVIQNHLDDYASGHGYDGILSAVSYAGSTHPVFGPQGVGARDWRDACWSAGLTLMAQYEGGLIPCPTIEQLLATLPQPTW